VMELDAPAFVRGIPDADVDLETGHADLTPMLRLSLVRQGAGGPRPDRRSIC
jgi:hypothetical protein